ncbi:MAG TPA: nucleotide disphospho-sugar-binding domain-containing protein, partial [Ilumatobacteraceae bacterium]|nr:nucleotide disphospho-sugar-binding domain-containing protein [Ilumatobacteraceae bacterium]
GTNLALHHGVPVVQVGNTEEKAEIGRRVEWAGVGIRLPKTQTTPELVDRAVRRVLTDDRYPTRAASLAVEYQRHHATTEIVEHLERLIDRSAAHHLGDGAHA